VKTAAGADVGDTPDWADTGRKGFRDALDDDLNMPEALGSLYQMVHAGNKALDAAEVDPSTASAAVAVLDDMDRVLAVLSSNRDQDVPEDVQAMVAARQEARRNKDWAESDRLCDRLAELGWVVRDTPEGPTVKKA
jgi:cysteinyl-tRNA synthetase